jgi:hypothetical protein
MSTAKLFPFGNAPIHEFARRRQVLQSQDKSMPSTRVLCGECRSRRRNYDTVGVRTTERQYFRMIDDHRGDGGQSHLECPG